MADHKAQSFRMSRKAGGKPSYSKYPNRGGFSFVELLTVMGLIALLATITLVSLSGRRRTTEIAKTTEQMAALLREAQSRSVAQASSTGWGVHFDNRGGTPFYALFAGTYSTSSRQSVYSLPTTLSYITSTIAAGQYAEVTFSQISGMASGSSTLGIYSISDPTSSSTINVNGAGAVSY
jgi:prepilin-type N-terminal cleavage/methylation domain-containing protein